MGSKILVPALLALLVGGCPKRQTTPRIVYVQAPSVPPSGPNTTADGASETLTIQQPGLPPTTESPPPTVAAPPPPQSQADKNTRPPRAPPRDAAEKAPVETAQPSSSAESPSSLQLEPQGGDVQEAVISKRLEQLTAELNDLEHRTDLSEDQRRTVNDASTFRNQSLEALHQRDLLRAKQLANKAGLLIKAVQERP
ncbi:MAG TPA: hypothetical protein VG206_14790 [Terriglobia bacterium]|nr:hypothetical protein [Terriglobia bacterium]